MCPCMPCSGANVKELTDHPQGAAQTFSWALTKRQAVLTSCMGCFKSHDQPCPDTLHLCNVAVAPHPCLPSPDNG